MFGFFRKKTPPLPPTDPALQPAPEPTPVPESIPEPSAAFVPEPSHAPEAIAPLVPQEEAAAPPPPPLPPTEAPAPVSAPAPVVPATAVEAPTASPSPEKRSWAQRLKAGLARTRTQLGLGLSTLLGLRTIDEAALEELEATLLMADCGMEATEHLMQTLRARWKKENLQTVQELQAVLAEALLHLLTPLQAPLVPRNPDGGPFIIMLAGINGSGKTTSIGKLAKHLQDQGLSVLLAAGDTFRAAAREQLCAWGERNGIAVIAQEGGDPAAVIFDAVIAAKARKIDVVLADTAGRLPTQLHLMDEIAKVKRVIAKAHPGAPHEVLLVLDANIGQNALTQVAAFDKAIGVTGLVLTKLDGTAKGGVVAAIARQCPKPLRFIGVGEGIDDLHTFEAKPFVEALFEPVQPVQKA